MAVIAGQWMEPLVYSHAIIDPASNFFFFEDAVHLVELREDVTIVEAPRSRCFSGTAG